MASFDLQQLELLFFALLGLIFLILAGLIVYVVLANRRQRDRMAQAQRSSVATPRPASQLTGRILSLFRDEVGAGLKVEVGGLQYRRLAEIQDPETRRQVVDAAFELIQFTGVLGQDEIAPASLDRAPRWREDLREGSEAELARIQVAAAERKALPQLPQAPDEVEEQFLSLLADMSQSAPSRERPGIMSSIQQRWTTKPSEVEQPGTFVDDIEKILQRRVQLIPALVGRDLHVRLGPRGSVRFVFEGQEYESLDDLPNMTAQELVRDSIREWDETT